MTKARPDKAYRRIINGKKFVALGRGSFYTKKSVAQRMASRMRKNHNTNTRVIPVKGGYMVYLGNKRK